MDMTDQQGELEITVKQLEYAAGHSAGANNYCQVLCGHHGSDGFYGEIQKRTMWWYWGFLTGRSFQASIRGSMAKSRMGHVQTLDK